jgi:methylmalonyl-CoA mutase
LTRVRGERDERETKASLTALTNAAREGSGNLLELSIAAARARASVGEISLALEQVFGRHQAEAQSVSGVYGSYYRDDARWQALHERIERFQRDFGRRPRMLVAKMGQDGHDRGAKLIATAFVDAGFDVDIGPLFSTPAEVARMAIDNDVHVIGVSTQAAGHTTLVPALAAELGKAKASDIAIVCGGVIPARDYAALTEVGVSAVFGPGTPILDSAEKVLEVLEEKQKSATRPRQAI